MQKHPLKLGKYADVLMDRWFKRTFGREQAKRLMQLFLQTLIPDREIAEISYGSQEHTNSSEADGKDIRLDLQCRDKAGDLFIVEVQLVPQETFYERAVFNSALVIQEQVPSGATDWDFAPVYFIGILNFSLHKDTDQVLFRYRLREDTTGDIMTDRVQYLFLEVPNCTKALTDDAQPLDNLCYALRNMPILEDRPAQMQGELFDLLFNSAEIRNFAPRERNEYISEMETERDRINQLAYAKKEGLTEGKLAVALNMLKSGMPIAQICELTGLAKEQILQARQ